jgi:hypothetical protein
MNEDERVQLADLLERWLNVAKIDLHSPPMIGEDDGDTQAEE